MSVELNSETAVFLQSLGFLNHMSEEEVDSVTSRMIAIFKNSHSDQLLEGSQLEQCRTASALFKDWPSILYLDKFLPTREPQIASIEDQKLNYVERGSNEIYNKIFSPLPTAVKQEWSEDQIIKHFQDGNPIYLRLVHKEEDIHRYAKVDRAILPSRRNATSELVYNPHKTVEAVHDFSFCALRNDGERFSSATKAKIRAIQEKDRISEVEAIFQIARDQNKDRKSYPESVGPLRDIFWEMYQQHGTCVTHRTPFKGMIGGTCDDCVFIEEMKRINSSFRSSAKVIVVIDFSARFLHNGWNYDQMREFLALGGILNSEIVAEMDKELFDKFIEKATLSSSI